MPFIVELLKVIKFLFSDKRIEKGSIEVNSRALALIPSRQEWHLNNNK